MRPSARAAFQPSAVSGITRPRYHGWHIALRIGLPPGAIKEIDEFLREHEVAPKPAAPAALPERDPGDQWILASAIESHTDVLVTGDRDLLDIAAAAPIKIIDPRGFWDLVRKNE